MVCWRETPDAARALGVAMPLLTKAERVVFAGVQEKANHLEDALDDVAAQFRWSGVPAEVCVIPSNGRPIAEALAATAEACAADLMVMGAYGHSHMREVIFGGCTQAMIRHAQRPVLLLH
jgi:nucleotide-binding universal stress UspA family protein